MFLNSHWEKTEYNTRNNEVENNNEANCRYTYVVPTIRFYYGPLNDVGKSNANDKDDDD